MSQVPTIGRVVHYTLTAGDAGDIMSRRLMGTEPRRRGSPVTAGEVFPMLITRVWGADPGAAVQGQVFLDGDDTLWVTSVTVGEGVRHFAWPPRP